MPESKALAVDLRVDRTWILSCSTCFWTALKFLRDSS